jgi:lipopolysaccharide export system protein LptA
MGFNLHRFWLALALMTMAPLAGSLPATLAQALPGNTITLRSDLQEANTETGIITARGHVYIDYPAEQIHATSAQAQYYSKERRIVLSGNVVVNQKGNTLQAEVVTYLVDEGRFVAAPSPNQQVQAVYLIPRQPSANNQEPIKGDSTSPSLRPPVVLDVSPLPSTP